MKQILNLVLALLISAILTSCNATSNKSEETITENTSILNPPETSETLVESEQTKLQNIEKFDRSLYSGIENTFIANDKFILINVGFEPEHVDKDEGIAYPDRYYSD